MVQTIGTNGTLASSTRYLVPLVPWLDQCTWFYADPLVTAVQLLERGVVAAVQALQLALQPHQRAGLLLLALLLAVVVAFGAVHPQVLAKALNVPATPRGVVRDAELGDKFKGPPAASTRCQRSVCP